MLAGMLIHALGVAATVLGLAGSLALLGQTRALLRVGTACEVSLLFLGISTAGYLTWLAYGMALSNLALVIVDLVGVIGAATTLGVAIHLRRARACPAVSGSAAPTGQRPPGLRPHPGGTARRPSCRGVFLVYGPHKHRHRR
jgi:uncharacterized protein with PQ loop repeat